MISAVSSMTAGSARRTSAMRSAFVTTAFAIAFAGLAPSVAYAQGPSNPRADALFKEGRELLQQKRYDEACPKLAEAQKAEPGAGTLLALALCHEGQGKTATAWGELKEAASLGRKVGRNDLAGAADKRAAAMEPSLSKLVIRVAEGGIEVRRDGERIAEADLGKAMPVDPGEHRIDVSAPGKVSKSQVVRLSGAGTVEIVIEPLEHTPRVADKKAAPEPALVTHTSEEEDPSADKSTGSGQRAFGLVTMGIGLAGIGVSAYFGGKAMSDQQNAKRSCPTTPCADGNAELAIENAKRAFNMSVIGAAAGAGTIALGAIFYFTAPSASDSADRKKPKATARIVPDTNGTQFGALVTGTF